MALRSRVLAAAAAAAPLVLAAACSGPAAYHLQHAKVLAHRLAEYR